MVQRDSKTWIFPWGPTKFEKNGNGYIFVPISSIMSFPFFPDTPSWPRACISTDSTSPATWRSILIPNCKSLREQFKRIRNLYSDYRFTQVTTNTTPSTQHVFGMCPPDWNAHFLIWELLYSHAVGKAIFRLQIPKAAHCCQDFIVSGVGGSMNSQVLDIEAHAQLSSQCASLSSFGSLLELPLWWNTWKLVEYLHVAKLCQTPTPHLMQSPVSLRGHNLSAIRNLSVQATPRTASNLQRYHWPNHSRV